MIKVAKNNFYCKKFASVKGDLKKTWKVINELRGKTKRNIKASFVIDGKVVEDRRTIANEFNSFFGSVAKKLNAKTHSSTLNATSQNNDFINYLAKNKKVQKSIFMAQTSPDELEKIVDSFQNEKSSDISIFVLKKCFKVISGYLAGFINHFCYLAYFLIYLR